MDRHILARSLVIAFCGLAVGCASGPSVKHKYLPKQYPTTAEDWGDNTIDRVEFIRPFELGHYRKVVLQRLDTQKVDIPTDNTRGPVERAIADFDPTLAEGMRDVLGKSIPVEVQAASSSPGSEVLIVRGAVTEINPGSRAARLWVGIYGGGRSRTEIEAQLVDGASGQVMVTFTHARVSSFAIFGGDYDEFIHEDITELGRDVGLLIGAHIEPRPTK